MKSVIDWIDMIVKSITDLSSSEDTTKLKFTQISRKINKGMAGYHERNYKITRLMKLI